jgi:predicted  nucleic acid-binding Zn-ribbon protein
MTYAGWHINQLRFTGKSDKKTAVEFSPGLSLIYGASNTGKSFAVKALDFMMGGQNELPNIKEREPYSSLWLDVTFAPGRSFSLERAIRGGAFKLHAPDQDSRNLAQKHDANNPDNISSFLLAEMGALGRKIAVDASGTHGNLSFRDIAGVILTNELAIQSEHSPVESGDQLFRARERSVFKYILTGEDDSAVVPLTKPKDFKTGRAAKTAILQEMIDQINADLAADYPDAGGLRDQNSKIDETLRRVESEIDAARNSVRELLDVKRKLSTDISASERRSVDIALSLNSFEQLEEVYVSDIARLQALEEGGFLLGMDGQKDCPVCGASPEDQRHAHVVTEVEHVRVAAEMEIQKIKTQRSELIKTMADTKSEADRLIASIADLRTSLAEVEQRLEKAAPVLSEQQRALSEVMAVRDRVRRGLDLLARREGLIKQKAAIESSKPPKRDDKIQSGISTETAKEIADVVSMVLGEWGFPGQKQVVFDLATHDLIIDGKERRNNGKGVRAITHAAFKVALMLFCRERNLPHPGILVLDTPLLTYRDPMKNPDDKLTPEEQQLRGTDLKERFFNHLGHLGDRAQILVFENVDPPQNIGSYARVETFTNDPNEGRQGLL